ncbi:site-specific DNA-methyltransferase [Bacillus subtilis]
MELVYQTQKGKAYHGNSLDLLDSLEDNSVNLVITSPPFALQRQKSYGNLNGDEYIEWLSEFARKIKDKITEDGSFVIDLGGSYQKGVPVRSLYNYKVLIKFVEELGFHLAEEFFWYNPSKLPSPMEWVNKRKIRTKDSVNTVWWFSKTEFPKADVKKVLAPYSGRMKKLLEDAKKYYNPKERPSGHNISEGFSKDNGGAIPSNLLQIPNSESNSKYLKYCKVVGVTGHPARFPVKLPEFFIKFLTDPNDVVLDVFSGSNTTGETAENLERRWISCELDRTYVATSVFRFTQDEQHAKELHRKIMNGEYVDLRQNTIN